MYSLQSILRHLAGGSHTNAVIDGSCRTLHPHPRNHFDGEYLMCVSWRSQLESHQAWYTYICTCSIPDTQPRHVPDHCLERLQGFPKSTDPHTIFQPGDLPLILKIVRDPFGYQLHGVYGHISNGRVSVPCFTRGTCH